MAKKLKMLQSANIFAGSDAIVNYLDQSQHSYTSLVQLPRRTKCNPLPKSANVRIWMKVIGAEAAGANTFKNIPVFGWYKKQKKLGNITRRTVVHINSSGGAGIAAVLIGRAMRVKQVRVYMPEDTPTDKQRIIRRAGGKLILTKDQPGKPTNVQKLRKMASRPNHLVFDQYGDDVNWKAHMKVTMRQIWDQMTLLGSFPGMVVAAKGTTGTLIAAREYAKKRRAKTISVGVQSMKGEPIPAVRPESRLGPDQILFDHNAGTYMVEVARYETYQMAVDLLRDCGLKLGLSSAAALCGAIRAAKQILQDSAFARKLRNKQGYLDIVVVSGDILDAYLEQLRVILEPMDL